MLARAAHRVMTTAAHYGRLANATLTAWEIHPHAPEQSTHAVPPAKVKPQTQAHPLGPVRLSATTSTPLPVLGAPPLPTPNPLAAARIHPTTLSCAHYLARLT